MSTLERYIEQIGKLIEGPVQDYFNKTSPFPSLDFHVPPDYPLSLLSPRVVTK